jgi:hypothetical protein
LAPLGAAVPDPADGKAVGKAAAVLDGAVRVRDMDEVAIKARGKIAHGALLSLTTLEMA